MPCSTPGPAATVTVPLPTQPPAAPTGLRVVSCTKVGTNQTRCVVAWDPVPGATRYTLEKAEPGGVWTTWYSGPNTSFTTPVLYCGQYATSGPFTVRVRAENQAGVSPWNQQTLYTTPCPEAPQPPATPTNLRVVSCTKVGTNRTRCTVAWDAVSGATSYRLEKKTETGYVLWYSGPATSFYTPELYCGQYATSGPFTVRVRAEGPGGVSGWNERTLYTTPCP